MAVDGECRAEVIHPFHAGNLEKIVTEKDRARYEKKKEHLFDNLGDKDPDTIPRNLQLLAGDMKARVLDPEKLYVARNKRLRLDNVLKGPLRKDVKKEGKVHKKSPSLKGPQRGSVRVLQVGK